MKLPHPLTISDEEGPMATKKKAETAVKDEAVKADEDTTLQTKEQRAETPIDGVDPFEANGEPDEGLHGNADY